MRKYNKWRVGIVSTDLDLKNERTILIHFLTEKGFDVVAFEGPNFARNMDIEKNASCLEAFNTVDIGLIIVGDRAGDTAKDVSITQKEYMHLRNFHKYTFVFVKQNVWYNYENEETKKNIKTASFLDYISKEEKDFIIPFHDIVHLKVLIEGRLKGLSGTLIQNFVESQYAQMMNSKTIPTLNISVQKQINDYFIEPELEPDTDVMGNLIKVEELYKALQNQRVVRRILVKGDIGSGKSTLLYVNYIEHYKAYFNKVESKIPLYVSLRGKTKEYTLDEFFSECFEKYGSMEKYPLFELKSNTYVLYVDGMDEMHNIRTYADIEEFLSDNFFEQSMMVTCRTNFYENYLRDSGLSMCLYLDLLVCKWEETKLRAYIDKIFSSEKEIREYVKRWMKNNFGEWLQTPLLTSIVCFLLKDYSRKASFKVTLGKIVNERTLLMQYTERFIEREIERKGLKNCEEQIKVDTFTALKDMGWLFYQQEQLLNYQMMGRIDNLEPALQIANDYLGVICFEKHYNYSVHAYFLDFTVSMYILDRMICNDNMEFLDFMLSANINKLIFQGLNSYTQDIKVRISENLFYEYLNLLVEDSSNIIRRTHIVYYLSRIDLHENKKKLKNILHDKEKEVEIKLSICFGMIKLGDLEEEEFLYNMLENDLEWDETNRGYHLLYYKDIEGVKVPFRDNRKGSWKKTFSALKNHICQGEQYYYLTRIDLQIIKKFLLSHDERGIFFDKDIKEIEESLLERKNKQDGFGQKITNEWQILKNLMLDNL